MKRRYASYFRCAEKHQAPAAFFVVGNFVRDNPDLIRRMTEEGHTVANHTLSHPDMSKISSVENFKKNFRRRISL